MSISTANVTSAGNIVYTSSGNTAVTFLSLCIKFLTIIFSLINSFGDSILFLCSHFIYIILYFLFS
jgi:hypothetical protein